MREAIEQTRVHLRRAGFPGTLLPDSVRAVDLDETSGRFRITLAAELEVEVQGHTVVFAPTLTGVLHPQRIWELQGVHVARGADDRPCIREVRTDERSTTVTFEVSGEHRSVPYDDFL